MDAAAGNGTLTQPSPWGTRARVSLFWRGAKFAVIFASDVNLPGPLNRYSGERERTSASSVAGTGNQSRSFAGDLSS